MLNKYIYIKFMPNFWNLLMDSFYLRKISIERKLFGKKKVIPNSSRYFDLILKKINISN